MKPATPSCAALEFAELESWLASHYALQLPLHRIESDSSKRRRLR